MCWIFVKAQTEPGTAKLAAAKPDNRKNRLRLTRRLLLSESFKVHLSFLSIRPCAPNEPLPLHGFLICLRLHFFLYAGFLFDCRFFRIE